MNAAVEFTVFDVWFIGAALIYLLISTGIAHVRCGELTERVEELERRK
jgi:hypothetical protein